MVKYLSEGRGLTILLLAAIVTIAAASKTPVPTCNSPKIALQDLPISLQETQTFNMDDFFSGYNLNITIPSKVDGVDIRPKLFKTAGEAKPMPGLKNYHFSHRGNQWGDNLVAISIQNNSTVIYWGTTSNESHIPSLTNRVVLENDTRVQCFDAVWLRPEMTILVDCVQNSSSLGIGLVNYFYYINSSSLQTLGKVKNDMYVGFTDIKYRKIGLIREDNYNYLIRAYFAQFVDDIHRQNTYAEIISINVPMKPWTIRVIDRSFLHQDKLSITDFEIYLGDIYILDYFSGVIKFDISKQQTILIVGRYRTDSGYTKLGVFSNNLDNEFLLLLAHNHSIIEVDWSNQIKPQILTKYSIPDNSHIHDLWCNEQYVVVQLTANLTDDKQQAVTYQSTYVMTRNSRTYTNAYIAIPHVNHAAYVDLNRELNQILTLDTEGINIYHLSKPMLGIRPTNKDLMGKEITFTVKAESANQYDPSHSLVCSFSFRFLVVEIETRTLWPTGLTYAKDYYANYPGQLFIPIDRYVLGGNITYGLFYGKNETPPTYYFLHQNSTVITWWDKQPTLFKYTLVRTEQFDSKAETQIDIYAQDANNVTHFSRCAAIPYTDEVHCFESTHVPHISYKMVNLTATRFHYYQGKYVHLAAAVFDAFPNEVFLYHVEEGAQMRIPPVMFPQGYEGQIQNIEFLGHYLVVVLRYVKEIVIYDMIRCEDYLPNSCEESYRINSTMMSKLGVNYFSPMDVYVSDFHPFVLFVQCLDRVVVLDMTRQGPILLGQVQSPATQEPGFYKWKMGIARGQLILVNPPNIIEEHDLDELSPMQDIPFNRVYPTYGYEIQDTFQLDFSDKGNLIYITALDKKLPAGQNSVIMVYRTGYPSAASFYDVFHLNAKYDDLIVEVTGNFGNYVTVAYQSKLMMFRQYEIPILVFEDVFGDFNFNLTYTNDPEARFYYLRQSSLHTANYPENIIINNTDLNSSDYLTATVSASNTSAFYRLDDSTWFNGSVINYTLDVCSECNKKLKVRNHINEERVLLGVHDMEDYAFSPEGGYIQQFQSIIKMRHNGSIHQFVALPSVLDGQSCMFIEHSWIYDYTLSACKNDENGGEIYLYTTVYTASKPFVNGPYYSSAKHVTSMHIMEELMILVDVDENPFSFSREGGVIIYAMNHDPFEPQIFDELEFIDSTDLTAANDWPGGPCYIGNAHFAFTNQTNSYRLVISELRNGLFIVDFRWVKGRKSVEIVKVEFLNLAQQLVKVHLPLPNMAFFTAVAINNEKYNNVFNYWETQVIVATSNFHSFLITLHIDKSGTVVSHELSRVFYRYGFYQNQNYIKAFDGYFAIGQKLPIMLHVFPRYSKLVLSVYDTRERWVFNATSGEKIRNQHYMAGSNVPVSYILGGYTMNEGDVTFDWNVTLTRNRTDPFRNIGLLALHNSDARIWELSVHETLGIYSENGITDTQNGFLVARNDYHDIRIPLKLIVTNDEGGLAGWAIALIVIGSIAAAGGIGYFLYLKLGKAKAPNRESQVEKSLLEREADQEEKDSDADEEEGEQGEEEADDEGEEEEEEVEDQKQALNEPPKQQSTEPNESEAPRVANDTSINRETVTSVAEEEIPAEVQQPNVEPKDQE